MHPEYVALRYPEGLREWYVSKCFLNFESFQSVSFLGEDEANCTQSADCSKDEFKCKNGRCIFRRWMCDHDDDCGDGSDEANCRKLDTEPWKFLRLTSVFALSEYTCGVAQIPCTSDHRCIPQRWQCDGERDCPDGTC